jgi:hypothetical protein
MTNKRTVNSNGNGNSSDNSSNSNDNNSSNGNGNDEIRNTGMTFVSGIEEERKGKATATADPYGMTNKRTSNRNGKTATATATARVVAVEWFGGLAGEGLEVFEGFFEALAELDLWLPA